MDFFPSPVAALPIVSSISFYEYVKNFKYEILKFMFYICVHNAISASNNKNSLTAYVTECKRLVKCVDKL